MGTLLLSKTTYLYGCQCVKRLWLNRYKPKLKDPISPEQAEKFNKGINFGKLARALFPGGIDVSPAQTYLYPQAAEHTRSLLAIGQSILYEATFIAENVMCAVDILVIKEGKAHVFEVKNALSVREEHVRDAALQYFVMTHAGIDIADFSIIHRSNSSLASDREADVETLFNCTSVLKDALSMQGHVMRQIKTFKEILDQNYPPDIAMGEQCNIPYPCNFKGFCSKKDIFNI